jgi:hypothetical protein
LPYWPRLLHLESNPRARSNDKCQGINNKCFLDRLGVWTSGELNHQNLNMDISINGGYFFLHLFKSKHNQTTANYSTWVPGIHFYILWSILESSLNLNMFNEVVKFNNILGNFHNLWRLFVFQVSSSTVVLSEHNLLPKSFKERGRANHVSFSVFFFFFPHHRAKRKVPNLRLLPTHKQK